MSAEHEEALEVLRAVWRRNGQTSAALADAADDGKTCKKMADVGFDGFAAAAGFAAADPAGADLTAAWRATLAREGKLRPGAGSIADLVLGPGGSR